MLREGFDFFRRIEHTICAFTKKMPSIRDEGDSKLCCIIDGKGKRFMMSMMR